MKNKELYPLNISDSTKTMLQLKLPDSIIKEKNIGKTSLSYISGATVIDLLNRTFNYMWDFYILDQWITEGVDFYNKYDKKVEKQGPVCHSKIRLVVKMMTEEGQMVELTKEACGSKAIIGKQSEQEHIFKSATTDALKKAASLLGIGHQLYRATEDEEFFEMINEYDPELAQAEEWTDEALKTHKENLDYITQVCDEFSEEEFCTMLNIACGINSLEEVTPVNIEKIVEFFKDQLEGEK